MLWKHFRSQFSQDRLENQREKPKEYFRTPVLGQSNWLVDKEQQEKNASTIRTWSLDATDKETKNWSNHDWMESSLSVKDQDWIIIPKVR